MELQVLEPEKKTKRFEADPTISFIVPVHAGNLDKAVFKRCLMSLEDQDYENMEVVIVINGGTDEGIMETAHFFVNKEPNKFKVVQTDTPGACNARNLGFDNCKGDIVSFFNSDYRAKPGMARMWVDTLLDHPDCGFAYGGYEYATAPAVPYYSKPFSPYLLEVANYIDCGFPLWRKHVVKWDPEVKSLQDWDFWIRVVKAGVKGFFIDRELSFIAEPPRPKGLSDDSSSNWVDRVKFVKNKNGIALSDLVVTSLGAAFHGVEIAKMLKADFRDDTITKPNEYKAVYMIGFYVKPDDRGNSHGSILGSFAPDVKKIIHFVGADIYWLRKFPYDSMKYLAGVMKMGSDHILCENEQAQKELKIFGIDATIVPIPPYSEYEVKPLPKTFKVALYLTGKSDFDKYAMHHTLSIVRAMPDVEFTGYGDGATDFRAHNFKHMGSIPINKFPDYVYDNSCVLRLVRHDTLPIAPCEFLLAGRDVVTNIPMDYAHRIDTKGRTPIDEWDIFGPGISDVRWPETKKQIVQKIRLIKKTLNGDRLNAAVHYRNLLDRQKYINTINAMAGIKGESNA